jgi:starvation-inducible outer membrane lipoprotein
LPNIVYEPADEVSMVESRVEETQRRVRQLKEASGFLSPQTFGRHMVTLKPERRIWK